MARTDSLVANQNRSRPPPTGHDDSGCVSDIGIDDPDGLLDFASGSMLELATAVKYRGLLKNEANFTEDALIECFACERGTTRQLPFLPRLFVQSHDSDSATERKIADEQLRSSQTPECLLLPLSA